MKNIFLSLLLFIVQVFSPAYAVNRVTNSDVINGQISIKNLLGDKGSFEKNALGWSGFDDTSSATPVDLTGDSPSVVSCARTASSPLSGAGSLLLTHTAADGRGEGCSVAFTIDTKMKFSVLQIKFDYAIPSGTYADNDLDVWIYDVTNSALIQPAPYHIKNHGVVSGQSMSLEFQATSGTSYRLGFYSATTTATAYTMSIDDITVGQTAKLYGSPITDPVIYNATYTGLGTIATSVVTQQKIGKLLRIQLDFTMGTGTAVLAKFSLPSGLSVDTTNFGSTLTLSGKWSANQTPFSGGFMSYSTDPTNIYLSNDGANFQAGVNGNTWAAGTSFSGWVDVPITGWSSSVLMSNDANTNVVAMTATGSSTSISGSTIDIAWTTTTKNDGGGAFDGTTYTVASPGWYEISSSVRIDATYTAGQHNFLQIYRNGNSIKTTLTSPPTSGAADVINIEKQFYCNSGDAIKIRTSSEGTTPTISSQAIYTHFSVRKISGPAQIAASETTGARYRTAAGQNISNNTTTIVDYGTKDFDYTSAVTTGASWKFTASTSGLYLVTSKALLSSGGGWDAGEVATLAMFKNGADYAEGSYFITQAAHTNYVALQVDTSVRLLAGDYIDVRVLQNSGGTIALQTDALHNYISITRVGNY